MFTNLFYSRPKLAKVLMSMMMKGQLDCAMMTDLQMQEADEAEAKLATLGDDFEILGGSTVLLSAAAAAPPAHGAKPSTSKASLSAPQVAPYAMDAKSPAYPVAN